MKDAITLTATEYLLAEIFVHYWAKNHADFGPWKFMESPAAAAALRECRLDRVADGVSAHAKLVAIRRAQASSPAQSLAPVITGRMVEIGLEYEKRHGRRDSPTQPLKGAK